MLRKRNNTKSGKKDDIVEYTCTIRFLDDSDPMQVTFQKETKGQWLLDYICKELNLVEKDYFGLRYIDADKQRSGVLPDAIGPSQTEWTRGHSHWLDPVKSVYKQLKNVNPMVLCFRVKFYPPDPMQLKEEITRYFLFLQLRRDLHHGRLLCSQSEANQLAAYIIQSEVGDYDPVDHPPGYVGNFNMLPKQTPKMEDRIAEIHKTLSGQVPSEAEASFLKKASTMDTYGVDPYQVKVGHAKDQKSNQLYLGVTHLGIVTFQGNKRTHLFRWSQVNKIAFEGKMFIVHITVQEALPLSRFILTSIPSISSLPQDATDIHQQTKGEDVSLFVKKHSTFMRRAPHLHQPTERDNKCKTSIETSTSDPPPLPMPEPGLFRCVSASTKKHACGFKCQSYAACRQLWRIAVEQQAFFTLNKSGDAPKLSSGGSFFTRGAKFRFSGRCQREVIAESKNILREPPSFIRTLSNPKFTRTFKKSATLPTRISRELLIDHGYETMKPVNHAPNTSTPMKESQLVEFVIPEDNSMAVSSPPQGDIQVRPRLTEIVPELDQEMNTTTDVGSPTIEREAPLAEEEDLDEHCEESVIVKDEAEPTEQVNLDAQIEMLQKELQQAKMNNVNHMEVKEEKPVTNDCKSNGKAHHVVDDAVALPVRRNRCLKVMVPLLISFGTMAVVVIVMVVLLFELKTDSAAVLGVRRNAHIQEFHHHVYSPVRNLFSKALK
ncbi:FERM domain-containing protein 5-like isoform X4 [Lineus longissimus]|uniref:FERM domain-containing protein 5-like isoform X4 n=1 Tax=Lineus longissimus TaxID=88925 RepID=UPI00315DDF08